MRKLRRILGEIGGVLAFLVETVIESPFKVSFVTFTGET